MLQATLPRPRRACFFCPRRVLSAGGYWCIDSFEGRPLFRARLCLCGGLGVFLFVCAHLRGVGELGRARKAKAAVAVASPGVELPLRGAAAAVAIAGGHLSSFIKHS